MSLSKWLLDLETLVRDAVEEGSVRSQTGLNVWEGGKTMDVEIMNNAFNKVVCEEKVHYIYFWLNFQSGTSTNLAHFISYIYMYVYIYIHTHICVCVCVNVWVYNQTVPSTRRDLLLRFLKKLLHRENKDANKNIHNPNTLTWFICIY